MPVRMRGQTENKSQERNGPIVRPSALQSATSRTTIGGTFGGTATVIEVIFQYNQ